MPSPRFLAALAASLSLHGLLLGGSALLGRKTADLAPPPPLSAVLLPPARATTDDSPLLKNTLSDGAARRPPPPTPHPGRTPAASAQRKLNEQVYYPPEAIAQGWEGEVRLLLTLDEQGRVIDVRIAASSGHAILDQAAVRAARAAGRLPGEGRREIIWPVSFRLER